MLASAVAFGFLPIFARLAYSGGAGTWGLLFVRFSTAFVLLGAILAARGGIKVPGRGRLATLLLLGAAGYFLQSTLYFTALLYAPVSVVALILYTYPVFVTAASFSLGFERPSARLLVALAAAMSGIVLVADPVMEGSATGVLLALGASVVYTFYIVISSRVLREVSGELSTFYVVGGAAVSFGVVGSLTGGLSFGWGQDTWVWAILIAVIPTVLALTFFFKGLAIVGPMRASILSTAEIVTSVAATSAIFGEGLSPLQALGGGVIIAASLLAAIEGRRPTGRPRHPRQEALSRNLNI
ncbi:MAG: DMT family transporter [Candidatus Methanosuratincola verstraetei]